MKAIVFHRPGHIEVHDMPDPVVTFRSPVARVPFATTSVRGIARINAEKDDVVQGLAESPKGYQIFNDKEDACVKVVLKP